MIDIVFPVAALLATFFVLVPLATLASRARLAHKRRATANWADFGSESTFAWLVMPTLVPLAWLSSAAIHQAEPSRMLEACLVAHSQAANCLDALVLACVTLLGTGLYVLHQFKNHDVPRNLDWLSEGHALHRRVAKIIANEPALASSNIRLARRSPASVFTFGWWRAQIILDACFVRGADDSMIRAALLHELAHARGYDTLRTFVARCSLGLNPVGHWLEDDFEHWRRAREAQCDSHAVDNGAEALALAQGIVRAAKLHAGGIEHCRAALLCGHHLTALKLRLALLLEGPPRARATLGHIVLGCTLLCVVITPHLHGPGALSVFHHAVECVLASHHNLP